MSGLDFRALEHLLPRAMAFRVYIQKTLRDYFEGLTILWADARRFLDLIYFDQFPADTRQLDEWDADFNLRTITTLTEADRRARLAARWKAQGGQSPSYIQETLQAAGFAVFVYDWWSDDVPTARDPNVYLSGGLPIFIVRAGEALAQAGEASALAGNSSSPLGYPLTNKTRIAIILAPGAGEALMQAGEADALAGVQSGVNFITDPPVLPSDPALFPHFVYIGGQPFPDLATVQSTRRDEFEELMLQLVPQEKWIGVLVNYA